MVNPTKPNNEPNLNYVLCTNPKGWHRMAYWEWGNPENEHVLLCMHGLTRNGRDFDQLAKQFSQQYRVICPDIVGRGQSDWLEDPDLYHFAQYVGDVATLIARLQPKKITWLGTSMGGLIALSFIYMLSQPAHTPVGLRKFSSMQAPSWLLDKTSPIDILILNDIGPELALEGLRSIANYVENIPKLANSKETLTYAKENWGSFGLQTVEELKAYTEHYFVQTDEGWVPHYDPAIINAFVRGLDYPMEESRNFLWSVYQQINVPILVLRGENSDLLTKSVYQRMLKENRLAQGKQFQAIGHAPSLLKQQERAVIEAFLQS